MALYVGDTRYRVYTGSEKKAFVVEIPPLYDAEIEYLESTGTQYIDTGITLPSDTTSVVLSANIAFDSDSSGKWYYFGRSDSGNGILTAAIWNTAWGNNIRVYNGATYRTVTNGKGTKIYIALTTTTTTQAVNINGTTTTGSGTHDISNGDVLHIIGSSTYTANEQCAISTIYDFQIYINDTLVFSGVPVRKGNVGYLYDSVSGTLFGNSGTGNFTLGPDKT